MAPRTALIALAAALAAATVVGAFVALDGRPAAPDVAQRADEGAPAGRTPSGRAPTEASSPDGARATATPDGPEPSAEPASSLQRGEVLVVRAGTREPLAGADVWCWPKTLAFASGDDFELWLRRFGVEARTDSASRSRSDTAGRARVQIGPHGSYVAAAQADRWGWAFVPSGSAASVELALEPDLQVQVRVVDPAGAPAGDVDVALRRPGAPGELDDRTARTDGDGRVTFRHLQHVLGREFSSSTGLVVALAGLLDPPVAAAVGPDLQRAAPIELVLPPHGSCEVTLVDAAGRALGRAFQAQLRLADADHERSGPAGSRRALLAQSEWGASVVFAPIALGRTLALELARPCDGTRFELTAAGPRAAGERTHMQVALADERAILAGRAVDERGVPLGGVLLRARLESDAPERQPQAAATLRADPEGRFAADFAPLAEDDASLALVLERFSPSGATAAVARRAIGALLAGRTELGDIALVEVPMLAAGVVLDERGAAVPGASVVPVIPPTVRDEDVSAPQEPLESVRTDERGRFELRGRTPAATLELTASKDGLLGSTALVRAGDRDVVLVLGPAAALAGRVLLDASLADSMVLVRSVPDERDAALATAPSVHAALAPDGAFALHGLRPGTHALSVVYAVDGTELAKVGGVRVEAGVASRDPRLDPLDLRDRWRMLELECVDPDGAAVGGLRAFVRRSDAAAEATWRAVPTAGSTLRILGEGEPLDVAIAATGFLRTVLDGVADSRRVVLPRAARLRLELAGVPAPDAPLHLVATVAPSAPGRCPGLSDRSVGEFDARGVLACRSAFDGELTLELALERRVSGSTARVLVEGVRPRTLFVAPHASEQVFAVELEPAALARAVEALEREL